VGSGWRDENASKQEGGAVLSVAAIFSFIATAACAQDFPKRPITMIVPFAAGGTSDVIARSVAEQMGTALAQRASPRHFYRLLRSARLRARRRLRNAVFLSSSTRFGLYLRHLALKSDPPPDLQMIAAAPAKLWTAGNCTVKGLFHPFRSP
jgi:hypothetical protein